jgi:hypothetical protein
MPQSGAWQQAKYSLLQGTGPSSSEEETEMAIGSKLIALKNRTNDQTTRITSIDYTGPADVANENDETVYRVYKRRWLGVAIIMLLNIVSSWR